MQPAQRFVNGERLLEQLARLRVASLLRLEAAEARQRQRLGDCARESARARSSASS